MWRNELALGWSEAIVALVVCTETLIVWRWRNQQKTACTVAELWLYPIKGCRGNKVERMAFDRVGPKGDRRWMIVDSQTKRFLSASEKRKMVLITPKLQDEDGQAESNLIFSTRPRFAPFTQNVIQYARPQLAPDEGAELCVA